IVNAASAQCQCVLVAIKPRTVVEHEAEEALLWTLRRISRAADAAAMLAPNITSEREGHLADAAVRTIPILHLDAVVAVVPHPARPVQRYFAQHVLVAQNG